MFDVEFPFKALICSQILSLQFHPCRLNPVCAYTVCQSTRGRQKLKLGLCVKKKKKGCFEKLNKGLNLELFWIWVLQLARHHVEYFFKEEYVDKSESHDCLATSDSQICFGFLVKTVKSIVITNSLVYRSGRCWCVLKRWHAEREKDVTITVPQWVCGLLKLSARNGELRNLYLLVFPLAF